MEVMVEPVPGLGHNIEIPRTGPRAGKVAQDHGRRVVVPGRQAEDQATTPGQPRSVVFSEVLGESAAGKRYDHLKVTLGTEVALDECRDSQAPTRTLQPSCRGRRAVP